ncbi:MAG: putative short-subunit dehydrogenase-like oxidoreductase (DUF2520 family) [Cyclobacteriaceae bacterium]|jgi:predicted short-subunit dehydrogenase-like oxidoreductase (DUF2520 family)
MPEQIAILGSGNVAYHLVRSFNLNGRPIKYLISRKRNKGLGLTDEISPKTVVIEGYDLKYYDFTFLIICVRDSKVGEVIRKLTVPENCVIVHTSGSVGTDAFSFHFNNYGVLYPFQTFSKKRELNVSEIPFFIEGSNSHTSDRILNVAKILSDRVKSLDSTSRANLHLTGVIINNFTNHLISEAFGLIKANGLDKSDLKPLVNETFAKAFELAFEDSQTGPAIRRDQTIITKHLEMLNSNPNLKRLYSLFTELIQAKTQ